MTKMEARRKDLTLAVSFFFQANTVSASRPQGFTYCFAFVQHQSGHLCRKKSGILNYRVYVRMHVQVCTLHVHEYTVHVQ